MIGEKGFSLIEVMSAIAIFGIVMGSAVPVFASSMRFNTLSETRTGAYNAARAVLDEIRIQDPTLLPTGGSGSPELVSVNDREYIVVPSYCLQSAYCTSSNTRHIHVAVSYRDEVIYEVETVFTKLR